MAIHNAWGRFLPTLNGNVINGGEGSLNLAKGELGIFNAKTKTIDGLTAQDTFTGASANDQFEIHLGMQNNGINRSYGNKSKKSRRFKLSEVRGLEKFNPSSEKIVDKFLIGYDGINDNTQLDFSDLAVGDTEMVSIKLEKGIIELLGYEYGCMLLNLHFEKESENQTNQEIVERAVRSLKDKTLKENIPVTDAISFEPTNNENPAVGSLANAVEHTFYNLEVNDSGNSNALAEVVAQFGDDVKRTNREGNVSTYTLLLPTIATSGVPADFVAPNGDTVTWTIGEACNAVTQEYLIQVPDISATGDRLAELQAAFPNLTIAVEQEGGNDVEGYCQTVYSTTVTSNIVCEDCDPALRAAFETEAPDDFEYYNWTTQDPVYDANAKMGILIQGKETVNVPDEYIRDSVPFINTSVRVSVAGGFRSSSFLSFNEGSGDRFAVKVLQRAADLDNLGGDLWCVEDRDFTYFNGYPRHRSLDGHQNEYTKMLLGEESVLKPNSQYITYVLTVQPKNFSQGFSGTLEESFNYTILAEKGKEGDVETLLNALATGAGVATV